MTNPRSGASRLLLSGLVAALMTVAAPAQGLQHLSLPLNSAAADVIGGTTLSWSRGSLGAAHIQFLYDSTQLTLQGVNQAIRIHQLRWRADGLATSWTGGAYLNATLALSTAATDASLPSATFQNNHGPDYAVVHSGPVAFLPGSGTAGAVGPTVVDITLSSPFLYDPSLGQDLLIDITIPSGQWVGGTTVASDAMTNSPGCSRVSTTIVSNATGTRTLNAQALVVDLGYRPVNGIYADFAPSVAHGPSPMAVQFTDLSGTSDPNGITAWAWDLDGDGLIDSTQQNPSFTYTSCGTYSVSLTVTDQQHGSNTQTLTNLIVLDEFTPNFSVTPLTANTFLFTDTSTPPGTAWAWDLDGDQVVDANGQSAVWTYPTTCVATEVSLGVSRHCRGPLQVSRRVVQSPNQVATITAGGTATSGGGLAWPGIEFDISVTNPQGITVCAISLPVTTTAGMVDFDFDVTEGSYVGKETSPLLWSLGSIGYVPSVPTPTSNVILTPLVLSTPVYLAPGNYGISVWVNDFVGSSTLISSPGPSQTYGNADVLINPNPAAAPGVVYPDWFSGTPVPNQAVNAILHYTPVGTYGEPGFGYFGGGCAGSTGSPARIFAVSPPTLGGTLVMDVVDVPLDVAFMTLGLSRTLSSVGPLPIDLAPVGAPGCIARVSTDITGIVFGSFMQVQWSLPVPNQIAFLGLPFYVQGYPLDPTANAFGVTASHAWAGIVGN